jgi:hypothetical protein
MPLHENIERSICDDANNCGVGKFATTKSRYRLLCCTKTSCFTITGGSSKPISELADGVNTELFESLQQGCFCPVPPLHKSSTEATTCNLGLANQDDDKDHVTIFDPGSWIRILKHADPLSGACCGIYIEVMAASAGPILANSRSLPGRFCLGNCYNMDDKGVPSQDWDESMPVPLPKHCLQSEGLKCPGEGWVRFLSEEGDVPMVKYKNLPPIAESEINGDLLMAEPYNFTLMAKLIPDNLDHSQSD